MTPPLVTLDEIRAAAKNIAGIAVRTPLLPCLWADGLYLKPENLQPVGAFKIRGAAQALASLPAEVRAAGVVTESSGNHGQALAYAGRRLGAPVVVVMPDVAVPSKIEATRLYGAEVMLVPAAERSSQRDRIARERGLPTCRPTTVRTSSPVRARSGWRSSRICPMRTTWSYRWAAAAWPPAWPPRSGPSRRT